MVRASWVTRLGGRRRRSPPGPTRAEHAGAGRRPPGPGRRLRHRPDASRDHRAGRPPTAPARSWRWPAAGRPTDHWWFFARPRTFDADEVSFVEALANVLAVAVDRDRSEQKFVHLGLNDDLTGLPNRTLLLDRIAQALARRRHHTDLAVLFLDIDRFKIINDASAIRGVTICSSGGRPARVRARPGDTLGRIGGDEFVVVYGSRTSRRRDRRAHPSDPLLLAVSSTTPRCS